MKLDGVSFVMFGILRDMKVALGLEILKIGDDSAALDEKSFAMRTKKRRKKKL